MRSLQPTLTDIFGSEPPTDPKAAVWEDDEVTVIKDDEVTAADDDVTVVKAQVVKAPDEAIADEDEVTAVANLSSLKFSLKSAPPVPSSLGAPDADDEPEEAVPTAPRPLATPSGPRPQAPPPPATPLASRLPLTQRAPVPPPPTRPPARKSAPPPTVRSAARNSSRPPPPPDPSLTTPGPARSLLLRPPPSDEALTPPPRLSIPPPPPSSRTTYVPPSVPPRGRIKLDSIDRLPSIGLPPAQLAAAQAFDPGATVPRIPPPPALPQRLGPTSNPPPALLPSLAPTSLSNPPPAMFGLGRPLRASAVAISSGIALGACLTLIVLALSRRGAVVGSDTELVMTAAAANGATLRGIELFVNGERRCSQMPCRVEGVGSGAHLVRLTVRETPKATPHLNLDELPKSVERPEPDLEERSSRSRAKREPASEAPPASEPAAAKAAQVAATTEAAVRSTTSESSPARSKPASNAAASPAAETAAAVSTMPAAPLGTIHVTSNMPANVAVDGRVLGRAPRSIRVSSGMHTVVVAGAKGRRVQSVRIDKGRTRRVSARF